MRSTDPTPTDSKTLSSGKQKTARPKGVFIKLLLLLTLIALAVLIWLNVSANSDNEPQIQTVSRDAIINKIQELNQLQTIAYNIDTIITSKQQGTWQRLWQDQQKGIFIARGRVTAGVDLSQLDANSITVNPPTQAQIDRALNVAVDTSIDNELDDENNINNPVNSESNAVGGNTLAQRFNSSSSSTQVVTLMPNIDIVLPPAQIFTTYLDDVEVYDWQAGSLFGMTKVEPEILKRAQETAKQTVLKRACDSGILNQAQDNAEREVERLFAMTGAKVNVTSKTTSANCAVIN